MTWTKLGDEFPDAAQDLSHIAFRTHVEALCWSNRKLLDLVIQKRDLRRFAEADERDQAARELVDAGWWQDIGDAWFIGVHFADWQRDRVQVEHKRQKNAEDQRRSRRHKLGDHSLCLGSKCRGQSAVASGADSGEDTGPDPGRAGTGLLQDGLEVGAVVPVPEQRTDAEVPSRPSLRAVGDDEVIPPTGLAERARRQRWADGYDR